MADIFISYASPDRERARRVAQRLEARGYSVWWDRTIPPGRVFDEVIQEALNASKCVIVLWSGESVRSNWVKTEASEAMSQGKLVPVLIESVVPPIEFKRVQAANLTDWSGDDEDGEFSNLLASVEGRLRSGAGARPQSAGQGVRELGAQTGNAKRSLKAGVWILAALLVAGVAAWAYKNLLPGRSESPASPAVTQSAGVERPVAQPPAQQSPVAAAPASPAVAAPVPSASQAAAAGRMNLIAPENGGQLVLASSESWNALTDGKEDTYAWVDAGEGVYAFKDERAATFDTFTVLMPGSADGLIKDFELLVADDAPTGHFRSIGKFTTRNMRVMKQPYQEFKFQPVTARYLKFKPISSHRAVGGAIYAHEFQLFGTLQ